MAGTEKNLTVQEKQALQAEGEQTVPGRFYVPYTDVFETEKALILVMEMPGVAKDGVDIQVENDVLRVEGRLDSSTYEELQPVYAEYNVGHFTRRFSLSRKIDQAEIGASITDGVLKIELPKIAEAQARKVEIR